MPMRDCFALRAGAPRMSADGSEAEIMLYGEIIADYGKWWKENFPDDKSAADFDKAVKEAKAGGAKKLLLRINSPGGIVTQAVAMRAILTGAGFESVTIRVEGLCASAATILASIPGAHVVITPGSEYMIHNPWSIAWGNAGEIEHVAEHLRALEATSRGFYAAKTGQDDERLRSWMDAETWFTAEQAVEFGFADELADELPEGEAAACVSGGVMAVMRGLYKAVPEAITVREDSNREPSPVAEAENVENESLRTVSDDSSNILDEEDNTGMDMSELTAEALLAGNPDLYAQVQQNAVAAERERLADIDALTLPGYEAMAEEAKQKGTSALDFQKQIVQAQKAKGGAFLEDRRKELAPAQEVPGGAPEGKSEDQEIDQNAKDIAEYAKLYAGGASDSMF